jgi:transcriptional regulator with XRE-family HTH domain
VRGDAGHSALGERIRAARLAHRPALRLIDLAGDELTAGMLSKIERGRVSPSLATLAYLARRLGLRPGQLLDGGPDRPAGPPRPWAVLGDARAALWLGDPAGAARRALDLVAAYGADTDTTGAAGAAGAADGRPVVEASALLAAALGLAAEAGLEQGHTQPAAQRVQAASLALSAGRSGDTGRAGGGGPQEPQQATGRATMGIEAHLAWVLGLLERRRGQAPLAERSWGHCLDFLEDARRSGPLGLAEQVLGARVLLQLGELHEATGATQTALNFLARASTALGGLADPAAAARECLRRRDALPHQDAAPETALGEGPQGAETGPAALAAVALAGRLLEQVTQHLARLDRVALRRPGGPPPEVSHSRHLR